MLDRNLARGLVKRSVGLNEDLSGLLVGEDNVADLLAPEVRVDGGHASVELGASLNIGGCLVDVQLLEIMGNSLTIR